LGINTTEGQKTVGSNRYTKRKNPKANFLKPQSFGHENKVLKAGRNTSRSSERKSTKRRNADKVL